MSISPKRQFEAIVAPVADQLRINESVTTGGEISMLKRLLVLGYDREDIAIMCGFEETNDEI